MPSRCLQGFSAPHVWSNGVLLALFAACVSEERNYTHPQLNQESQQGQWTSFCSQDMQLLTTAFRFSILWSEGQRLRFFLCKFFLSCMVLKTMLSVGDCTFGKVFSLRCGEWYSHDSTTRKTIYKEFLGATVAFRIATQNDIGSPSACQPPPPPLIAGQVTSQDVTTLEKYYPLWL